MHLPRPFRLACLLATAAIAVAPRAAEAQTCGSTSAGDCLAIHATPACRDATCCNTVCALAPDCCLVGWDASCVDTANSECDRLCGSNASGPCTAPHVNPTCANAACCATVCAADPFCCSTTWDGTCVVYAELFCTATPVECGTAGQGACDTVHADPGCADATCCTAVCAIDPSCCSSSWDSICVQLAGSSCSSCSLTCPAGSTPEAEACGDRSNDACQSGQASEAMPLLQPLCGTLDGAMAAGTWAGDRDSFSLTATDGDGDGKVRVAIAFSSNAPAFAALVPATCPANLPAALIEVSASGCQEFTAGACIAPGAYRILVLPGTFPTASASQAYECSAPLKYVLRCTVTDSGCTPTCSGATGPCFDPHPGTGCETAACCQAACVADPFCCQVAWDTTCARTAASACNVPVPPNDQCGGALPLSPGDVLPFSTIRASIDPVLLPASCNSGTGSEIGPDIWYVYDGERSGNVVVTTCGSTNDMRLAVYNAACGSLTLLACNSNSVLCTPTTGARVQFQSTCGNKYLIRVGGENPTVSGSGTIRMTAQGPICPAFCPADLNRDGTVSGADLGLLLGNWGWFGLGDLDLTGQVDGADLGILLGQWGTCPPPPP